LPISLKEGIGVKGGPKTGQINTKVTLQITLINNKVVLKVIPKLISSLSPLCSFNYCFIPHFRILLRSPQLGTKIYSKSWLNKGQKIALKVIWEGIFEGLSWKVLGAHLRDPYELFSKDLNHKSHMWSSLKSILASPNKDFSN
jgi:hypothetical protein